jgi:hypothetical protein
MSLLPSELGRNGLALVEGREIKVLQFDKCTKAYQKHKNQSLQIGPAFPNTCLAAFVSALYLKVSGRVSTPAVHKIFSVTYHSEGSAFGLKPLP